MGRGGGWGSAAERVISGAAKRAENFSNALILRTFDHDREILNLRSSSSGYTYTVMSDTIATGRLI